MNFISQHWANIVGGGSAGVGGGAIFFMVFRDSIKQWLDDWKDERRARRSERLAAAGKDDRLPGELIRLLTKSIDDQRENGITMRDLLTRMVVADERSLDVQRQFSNQFQDVDKRLSRMEGVLRIEP